MINNIIVGKELLETITSALYEDPIILFREYIQNSVDAYKKAIKNDNKTDISDFQVSIEIDEEARKIIILDNGYGIYTNREFYTKMTSFGNSDKTDRSQYIGFRGIGRLSAMPFCNTLQFINKAEGSNIINICKWEGSKYRDLLNSDVDNIESFESMIKKIANIYDEETKESLNEHYFKVIIDGYTAEVDDAIKNVNFEQRLRKMLPLKYSEDFSSSAKIVKKYNQFMAEDLNEYMYSVILNGKELRKNYTEARHVLESDIVFWEIRGKLGPNNRPGEKIGVLWFTFNKKITSNVNDNDYGILVRSKNILMGDNDTFADLCVNSKQYVSTYRELTQTLRGIYGELLINSINLRDNARREWFKTDEYSYFLKNIIIDFMKRLKEYRYCASKYYSNKEDENKQHLTKALMELIDIDANNININTFYENEYPGDSAENFRDNSDRNNDQTQNTSSNNFIDDNYSQEESDIDNSQCENTSNEDKDSDEDKDSEESPDKRKNRNKNGSFADEDIPRQTQTKKKMYDEIMNIAKFFFEKEKKYELFLKLRAFIKKYYN